MTPTADDAAAVYRARNRELIERLEAAGHEPVVESYRMPTQIGAVGRTRMYCRRCGREADRVIFNRLTPSTPCRPPTGQPPPS